jgi:hypothetical protein
MIITMFTTMVIVVGRGWDDRWRQPQRQRSIGGRDEPVGRHDRSTLVEGLVRTVGVIRLHPRVQRLLGSLHALERAVLIEEVRPQRAVKALDFAVLVR